MTTTSAATTGRTPSFKTTPDICDDIDDDNLQIVDPAVGIHCVGSTHKSHFGGQIVTVKCHEDNSLIKKLATSMDGTSKVMVVDGGGSRRRALLGDQVASSLVESNWEGIVIYGSIRDIDEIQQLHELSVYALGTHPRKTEKRNEGQVGIPVKFGGVTFHPGHWIVCDNNGIVVSEKDPRTV
eukprot:CAMPEP_0113468002 /NCGR_PEP_ID=MMETSP0014_2-20120614/15112_1 /TAXON_ID=2857 /ORGANISM="Nitzschia sp." /LENGTH=181 /DNA_ID=CAMNT_0000360341 /DNA_START=105 /DNA_END=650 /DNA_ORIENTATION=- /assembly_acc=CAM_ASM_000159